MTNINISPRLIRALEILRGSSIDENQAKAIDEGRIDYTIGRVILQSTINDASENKLILTQLTIRTNNGEDFTFSNNKNFINNNALLLGNADLINRPKITYISNLDDFSERFKDAAKYGQKIACLYEREEDYKLILVGIANDSSARENLASYEDCWPCLG